MMTIPHFRRVVALAIVALLPGIAIAASSYKVSLPSDLLFGGITLKAGNYNVSLEGKNAVFKKGKDSIPIRVNIEKNATKFSDTKLEISASTINAIDLGGTDMIITFRKSN